MTALATATGGALVALLLFLWEMRTMSEAMQRLDGSVARIAKDVGEIVERIRSNVGEDSGAILADCDRLDALSEALERVGTPEGGESGGETSPAPATGSDEPQPTA